MLWTRFSLRLSINVIVLSIPSTLTSTHSIRLQAPHFTVGDGIVEVMIIACFPLYIVTKDHKTRKSCFSQSESPLGVFLPIPSGFSCVFTEERTESGIWTGQIGGVLQ